METVSEIEITPGATTRVRLEIPEDYEARLCEMIVNDRTWAFPDQSGIPEPRKYRDVAEPKPLELTVLNGQGVRPVNADEPSP